MTPSRPDTDTARDHRNDVVFLVHGVGSAEPGTFTKEARPMLRSFGISEECIQEYNWHSLVGYPVRPGGWLCAQITWSYFLDVIAAFRSVSRSDAEGRVKRVRDLVLGGTRLVADGIVLIWCMLPVLLFQGAMGKTADLIPSVFTTSLRGSGLLLAIALVLGCLFALLYGEVGSLRRLVFVALRPLFFVSLGPFLFPLGRVLLNFATIILGTFACVPLFFPLAYHTRLSETIQFAAEGGTLAVIVAASGLCLSVALLLVFGPVLKIVSDVIRYAGDAQYRERIQTGVAQAAKSLGPLEGRRVFLVGHSLGSVIAVNSLLREDSPWARAHEVVLVTMGSPLRRLLHRFFPESCPAPGILGHALLAQRRIRCWINVFRPFDPVGTSLFQGAAADRALQDLSTGQFWRVFLLGHFGYWSDRVVAKSVADGLVAPATQTTAPIPNQTLRPLFSETSPNFPGRQEINFLPVLVWPIGIVWLFLSLYSIAPKEEWKRVSHIRAEIQQHLKSTTGHVTFLPRIRSRDVWQIRFTPEGEKAQRTFSLNATTADMAALQQKIGSGRAHEGQCDVIYSWRDPQMFMLSEFLPSTNLADHGVSAWRSLLGAVWFGSTATFILIFPSLAVWNLYLGRWKRTAARGAGSDRI